ncbi:IS200/IS605 family transposase [Algoriphagus aquimarinus]|uniref:IS200/IS605 family transposase n=1 Tax=Algoriphagus aquimarinus TaxID=237018 RepID=UPI0030DDD0EC|tara:strand:+ start:11913 stop:12374 length:462 start_codon:yes stop_codon:yes gene_type:complete
MANAYTQLYVHIVFAVKFRNASIQKSWDERLHKYLTGIFQKNKHKMIQINSMPDHIHIFIGLNPDQSISSIVGNVKSESTKWIKREGFCSFPFAWQDGYGAFSHSRSQLSNVISYIVNQEAHHAKKDFLTEYQELLKAFEIDYNEAYIFKELI